MRKKKVLIVGSFPKDKNHVTGGIQKNCSILQNSSFFEYFNVKTINITNPDSEKKRFIVRLILGIRNTIIFLYILLLFRPNAVIIFSTNNWGLLEKGLMGVIGKIFGSSIILCPRASESLMENNIMKKVVKFIFSFADYLVCQGEKISNIIIYEYGVKKSKVVLIRNWTATKPLLEIGNKKIKSFLQFKKINIVFVGWLEKTKGIEELLLSALALKEKKINFKLWVVGDGSQKLKMENFSKQNNLFSLIEFTSWQSELELREIYKKSHIFLLPSWTEGLPNSMIEAMATGCVPVVTNVGNISDFINESNGVLVKPKQLDELIEKLIKLIINENNFLNLATASYNTAVNNFSTEKNIKKLLNLVNYSISKNKSN